MANVKVTQLPLYLKIAQIIIGIFAVFYILYVGRSIILPLLFATILAILLNPIVNFLHRKKVNRILAIFIALLLALGVLAALIFFIISQISSFSETFPLLKERFAELFADIVTWVSGITNVSTDSIYEWLDKMKSQGIDNSPVMIGRMFNTLTSILIIVFVVPVYIFFILFYKPLLLEFIAKLFSRDNHEMVAEVLVETKSVIQRYLIGLLIETAIVAGLNITGFLILGLDYAILLGLICGLLNIIPYIGGFGAMFLPMSIALVTQSPTKALLVVLIYLIVQFIDNNYIAPKIVASKVKINALISIIVVLIGGTMWGIAGMFLAVPLTAILKVIFDRLEPLKPLGFLLGDTMPAIGKGIFYVRRKRGTKKDIPIEKTN